MPISDTRAPRYAIWTLRRSSWAAAGMVALALIVFAKLAMARVAGKSEYSKAQTYSGALRYLRLDLGYEVTERDPEAAYLMFRYQVPGQSKSQAAGTVEIIDADGQVKLFVQIATLPEYHERVLRDGLLRKLREEYGVPRLPAPAPAPPKKPEGDAGAD